MIVVSEGDFIEVTVTVQNSFGGFSHDARFLLLPPSANEGDTTTDLSSDPAFLIALKEALTGLAVVGGTIADGSNPSFPAPFFGKVTQIATDVTPS